MFPATIRRGLYTIFILMLSAGLSSAREPATVTQAAEAITSKLSRCCPVVSPSASTTGRVVYAARSTPLAAFAFQKETLEERAGKSCPAATSATSRAVARSGRPASRSR